MAPKRNPTTETPAFKQAQRDFAADVFGLEYCEDIRSIPEGKIGDFEVKDDIDIDQSFIYQQLLEGDTPITDNHPDHLDRHKHFLDAAQGHVLISGLGLGDSLHQVLQQEGVEYVTVVEQHQEVIDLVAPAFAEELAAGRVALVQGDIFSLDVPLGNRYDTIYHAIWNEKKDITTADRAALEELFSGRCDWHGFVFSPGRGGVRPGAGRPKGTTTGPTKENRRDVRKGVRFTDLEYLLITKACEVAKVPESTVMQRGAVAEARRILQQSAVLKDPDLRALLKS